MTVELPDELNPKVNRDIESLQQFCLNMSILVERDGTSLGFYDLNGDPRRSIWSWGKKQYERIAFTNWYVDSPTLRMRVDMRQIGRLYPILEKISKFIARRVIIESTLTFYWGGTIDLSEVNTLIHQIKTFNSRQPSDLGDLR
jgi:hypothetical protein